MRIWHQSMTELHSLGGFKASLEAHSRKILAPDQILEVHGMPPGTYCGRSPTAGLSNAFVHHRALDPILDNAIRAEREGIDAFVVGSYSEPYLRELRSAVDIPVISITEASLFVACSLGKFSAPISNDRAIAWIVRLSIETHGLSSRVMTPRSITPNLDEHQLVEAFKSPQGLIRSCTETAQTAIDEGADVIVPAVGVLAEFLYMNGINRIDSVPVLDSYGVTWAYAAMMADLHRKTGLTVGRKWHYQRDDPDLVREIAG